MRRVRMAYRDNDRTPFMFCVAEMAKRHYDIDVQFLQISDSSAYEAALFDNTCDVIIERLEYLYREASRGRKVTMFCAPASGTRMDFVVRPEVNAISDLEGHTVAVRTLGRPHTVTIRLRKMGLSRFETMMVADADVGRWGQWKKVVSGECVGAFMTRQYLSDALEAGLKVLPTPDIETVGHFSQACLTSFANGNPELMRDYVKAVLHALCLVKVRRSDALAIACGQPMQLMKIQDKASMEHAFDAIMEGLEVRPYPTCEGIANSYEIANTEWPVDVEINPLSLWDMHWVKELDDEGFIDDLIRDLDR